MFSEILTQRDRQKVDVRPMMPGSTRAFCQGLQGPGDDVGDYWAQWVSYSFSSKPWLLQRDVHFGEVCVFSRAVGFADKGVGQKILCKVSPCQFPYMAVTLAS